MAENNTYFGTYHIADNPKLFQPVRTNNFVFLAYGLEGIEGVDGKQINNPKEYLELSVVKFDAPHFKQDEISVQRGNSTVYYAGKASFDAGNLVVNDFVGVDSKSILEAWQNLSYNVENDTIPSSDVYKKNCVVLEYLPDNTLVRYWDLYGCWITKLSETGWDNETSSKKQVTATIRYDRAVPRKPDDAK